MFKKSKTPKEWKETVQSRFLFYTRVGGEEDVRARQALVGGKDRGELLRQ